MAVAFDASSTLAVGTGTSRSWTHTPSGTPKGVIVLIANDTATDLITQVTYNGIVMPRRDAIAISSSETGGTFAYFLGEGVPSGAQTVAITAANGSDQYIAAAISVTAGANVEVVDTSTTSGDLTNPSVTLTIRDSRTCFCAGVVYSGQNSPGSIAAGTNTTSVLTGDFGNDTAMISRWSGTLPTADATYGYTIGVEQAALTAIAISEILPTSGNAARFHVAWGFR